MTLHCTQNRISSKWKIRPLSTRSILPQRPAVKGFSHLEGPTHSNSSQLKQLELTRFSQKRPSPKGLKIPCIFVLGVWDGLMQKSSPGTSREIYWMQSTGVTDRQSLGKEQFYPVSKRGSSRPSLINPNSSLGRRARILQGWETESTRKGLEVTCGPNAYTTPLQYRALLVSSYLLLYD